MLLLILSYFLPFYPHNSPKNENFEKMKKCLEMSSFYICVPKIIIRWCMVPEIWCVTDVIISHFGLFFKIKILKKWKKRLEISSFYIRVPKIMIRWCTVPEIWCVTDVTVISHFGLFLPFYPPNSTKKKNFFKNEKNTWRYHFTYVY